MELFLLNMFSKVWSHNMIEKFNEICDMIPDTIKMIIIISVIAIFWDIVI